MAFRNLLILLFPALACLLASCPGGGGSAGEEGGLAIDVPPAGVLTGEPLAWRELAYWPEEASLERPRPGIVTGEFTGDDSGDVLLVDWMGDTEIIEHGGQRHKVDSDIWPVIIGFTAWDYNRDGVAELVPENYGLIWVPEVQGTVKVGSG